MSRLLGGPLLAFMLVVGGGAPAALAEEHGQPEDAQQVAAEHGESSEHGGEHGIDPKTLTLQLLNFGVLLFLLIKFGGKAINNGLRARHEQLKSDLEEAARLKAAAETRFKEQEQRLANLESELEEMRRSILAEAQREKARIIAAAEERARRVQEETRFQLDQQVKDAEQRFRAEVAQAALKVADELLRRSVSSSDEQRLAQSFVADLAATDGSRAVERERS
jgi:F-type H+-transporting ATPase subunit b